MWFLCTFFKIWGQIPRQPVQSESAQPAFLDYSVKKPQENILCLHSKQNSAVQQSTNDVQV